MTKLGNYRVNHGPLLSRRNATRHGEQRAEHFAEQRLEANDVRHFDAVQVALDLGNAGPARCWLHEHDQKRSYADQHEIEREIDEKWIPIAVVAVDVELIREIKFEVRGGSDARVHGPRHTAHQHCDHKVHGPPSQISIAKELKWC
jgi:hypothetical protein